jgi:hypothetical protein
MPSKEQVKIESLNNFEHIFLGRKLVNNEKLKLIKMLRSEGCEVTVLPNDANHLIMSLQKASEKYLLTPLKCFTHNQ